MFKSGYAAVIGRPNVGKSTFLNQIIGEKISAISNKPQTTRNKIQMIYTADDMQIVFLDTPGMQKPKNKLGDYMLSVSESSLGEADLIIYIVDCSEHIGRLDSYIIDELKKLKDSVPIILLINKIDEIEKDKLLPIIEMYSSLNIFSEIIPISAITSDGINLFLKKAKEILPEGPMYYPDDMITDQSEKFIVGEMIREKALINLDEEVPHGVAVSIDSFKEKSNIVEIDATIFVEKESHKGIIIGKSGSMLKKIGSSARYDLEHFLGKRVMLHLWVKVEKNWREKDSKVKYFGYK
ncbi:GTPase Era [Peptoniphilus sp. GNH]|nr:GTPase Era [Peptoniphilus sp. GNH]